MYQSENNKMVDLKIKSSSSIKKVLKMLFNKQQQQQQHKQQKKLPEPKKSNSLESLESWENLRNAQVEEEFYEEIDDNYVNEKLANMVQQQQQEEQDIYVPVRFARTTAGTFFWTTNLQPAFVTNVPAADEDLVQPAYCYSTTQYPHMQFQDRWAQA